MKISKILKRFFVVLSLLVIIFSLIKIFLLVSNQTVFELLKTPKTKPLCQDCNIIMISLDTLGAKHLPCYGYFRDTAPNLCKFASENILFKNAFSNASWTLPSHVSIFTSLYPTYHNVVQRGDMLSPKIPFLPEILQNNRYETYFYIPSNDSSLPINGVYSRGITKIVSDGYSGPSYFDDALNSFLFNVKEGKKIFAFLHTYAVHDVYILEDKEKIYTKDNFENYPQSWEEYDRIRLSFTKEFYEYLLSKASLNLKRDNWPWTLVDLDFYDKLKNAKTLKDAEKIVKSQDSVWYDTVSNDHFTQNHINISDKSQIEYLQALYDQKIHELDEWIGEKLIPFLENPAVKNNTIVIITSDHGEEFMEHGNIGHQTLYEYNVRVPLIVYIPGITNKTITASVQGVDIVPTILDVVGISSKKFLFQGYSLIDSIQRNSKINRLLFADGFGNEAKTIRKENWKLFLIKDGDKYIPYELYDTELDPNELNNVLSSHMDIVNKIKNESDAYEQKWFRLLPFEHIAQ